MGKTFSSKGAVSTKCRVGYSGIDDVLLDDDESIRTSGSGATRVIMTPRGLLSGGSPVLTSRPSLRSESALSVPWLSSI